MSDDLRWSQDELNAATSRALEAWFNMDPGALAKLGLTAAERDSFGLYPEIAELVGDRLRFRFAKAGYHEPGVPIETYPMVVRLDPSGWTLESVNVHNTGWPLTTITIANREPSPEIH